VHLDNLAQQGMRFTDAYAAAPVCSPTRASLMTGKHPARLHMTIWYESARNPPQDRRLIPPVTENNLPHAEYTLAEFLQSQGYITAHVGKWHLGNASHYPETHGFDVTIGGTFWGAPATYFAPYRGPFGREREFRYVPDLPWPEQGEYLTDRLTSEALQIMEQAADRPFFMYLAYHTVHTPIEAKAPVVEAYRRRLSTELNHQNATYAAMVASLDENVGRILEGLEKHELADKTLVIFTSDNGGQIGKYDNQQVTNNAPLRSGKGSLYEGGLRVPLLIRWPDQVQAGTVCSKSVVSTDLYSTIMQIVDAPRYEQISRTLDGRSLLPLLKEPAAGFERRALYFHYPHYYSTTTPASAVRDGDWKLIEYFEDNHVELYNLQNDLGETKNLVAELPERASALRQQLDSWRSRIDAQLPRQNPQWNSPQQP
jgi:arylsulfatase A-like enzyme